MKVVLNVLQRMKVSELLADQIGSFFVMKSVRKALEDFSISEEEAKIISLTQNPSPDGRGMQFGWDRDKDPMREFDLGEVIVGVIKEKLKSLDARNALRGDQLDLYELFVENQK